MKASLSVFFPVFNSQSVLASQLADLLEVLPELTTDFEVVVIDDGSTDATCEVVHELSAPYPQVHSVVHPARWGQAAAMRTGLLHSSGNVVLMRGESCEIGPGCLLKMWLALANYEALLAWPQQQGRTRKASEPSWSLVRRATLEAWRREADDDNWLDFVRSRARLGELEFPVRAIAPRWHAPAAHKPGEASPRGRRSHAASGATPARRPNYLGRLKSFALGE